MRGKKAEGYVFPCIVIIFISMLMSILIMFVGAVKTVNESMRATRTVLDNCVMTDSILIYDDLKESNEGVYSVSTESFIQGIMDFCGLEMNGEMLYYYNNGVELYRISKPSISFIEEDTLKVRAQYKITVPLRLGGVLKSEATIPITVDSLYNDKF